MIELWEYVRERKRWLVVPFVAAEIIIGLVAAATQGSAIAPFIYAFF